MGVQCFLPMGYHAKQYKYALDFETTFYSYHGSPASCVPAARKAVSQCHALWCACDHLGMAPDFLHALAVTLRYIQANNAQLILCMVENKLQAGGVAVRESEAWR